MMGRIAKYLRNTIITAFAISMTSPASAVGLSDLARQAPRPKSRIVASATTVAPFAFIRFCVNNPEDCASVAPQEVRWDQATKQTVSRLNAEINRRIRPRNDTRDLWMADVKSGDCEDYALTKRRALVAGGLPASALRIAVARTPEGEGHAVLVITTDAGDFVLDNRTNRILSWRQVDLSWQKISSAEDPKLWLRLN